MAINFVTGGTGFVGSHVVEKLLEKGEKVRALVRPKSDLRNLKGFSVESVKGDLRDPLTYTKSLQGCNTLYHVAAEYTLWVPHAKEIYASNVDGTLHLIKAALDAGVQKIVYTSTVGTLGILKDGTPAHEETPVTLKDMISHYKRSKFLAEEKVKKLADEGAPIVIVNPSTPVGTRDIKPTPTGQMIVDFLKGRMKAYVETGLNLVDVEDVARGHLLAAEKGKIGERYILGCENLTLKEIFEMLSSISGISAPRFKIPYAAAWSLAALSTAYADWVSHRPPSIPLDGVRMSKKLMFFDSSKAMRELGFRTGSVKEALEKAVHWFRSNGYASS
ncbi:MAG: NAD-dependent epimerase/dehydratase family protein [Chlamydiae bacterium]|nr:NAD-dependent epimerase/dehydratase family protein [Chlamydiota bacterium]MBI3276650.1 NAD-dependent epimerase/dehydratase family protein [Chlamydiota bacterium]